MTSRDAILKNLSANKPELIDLPIIETAVFDEQLDLIKEFTKKIEVVGGSVVEIQDHDSVLEYVQNTFPNTSVNYSTLANSADFNSIDLETLNTPHDLEDLDILILESKVGIAENGAIWLTDSEIPVRVLPFITKHLVIVLSQGNLVSYMHQAYDKIAPSSADYGVFISGPSKTADIEQSLVIGAHGALSLTVLLTD
ncbi:LutC/YkgG family protein [Algibacter mikhailovii]|uniref:LutC/YkgG family protein n=1 Tax=Algibacter mikhailovii TaxID=425498 RepID=UPI00249415E6|nr:LUD domain-containing protein [Algibacter mikhailovii]